MRNQDGIAALVVIIVKHRRMEIAETLAVQRRLDFFARVDHVAVTNRRSGFISLKGYEPARLVILADFFLAVFPRTGQTRSLIGNSHKIEAGHFPSIPVALV